MKFRNIVIVYFVTLILCIIGTAGAAYYFEKNTARELIDIATYVAVGFFIIGVFARSGANTGGDAMLEQSVRSVSVDSDAYDSAESEDMARGITFGWTVIAASVTWGGIAYLIYVLVDK